MQIPTILTCTPKPRQFKLRNIITGEIESFASICKTARQLGLNSANISHLLSRKFNRVGAYILPETRITVYKISHLSEELTVVKCLKRDIDKHGITKMLEKDILSIKASFPSSFNGLTYVSEVEYQPVKVNRLPEPRKVKSQVPTPRDFKIKNALTGEITSHKSINKFTIENNLKSPSIHNVVNGKRNIAGVYCRPETQVKFLDIYNLMTKKWEKNCNLRLDGFRRLKGIKQLELKGRYGEWVTAEYLKKHEYEIDLPTNCS